jgi:hypothetical protein
MRNLAWLLVGVLSALPLAGQEREERVEWNDVATEWRPPLKVGANCAGGIQVDDGTFEDGYGFGVLVSAGDIAQRFDLPGEKNTLQAVCVCMSQLPIGSILNPLDLLWDGQIGIWAADGPGGSPGTQLASFPATFSQPQIGSFFHRFEANGLKVNAHSVFVGPTWSPLLESAQYFVCADENGPGGAVAYTRAGSGAWKTVQTDFPEYKAVGVRMEAAVAVDPVPPAGAWLTTPALSGYQFKVRINGAALGTQVADCVPETLCVAGAIPTRTELFLRIIGPRPNGFLWSQVVRFTTSRLEVWIQQISDGTIRYYELPAVATDSDTLPGLVDKTAFQP